MADELKDYTKESGIEDDLVSKDSLLRSFDEFTGAMEFDQEFEGVPGEDMIFGGLRVRKKEYAQDSVPGIWIGVDSDGKAKMNVGDATDYMKWDGDSLEISGEINATSGTIGGWTIGATSLTGGDVELDSLGNIYVGDQGAGDYIQLSGADSSLYAYDGGEIRTYLGTGVLGFNTPAGVASGAIYGFGTNQLAFDVGGGDGFYLNEGGIEPSANDTYDLGTSSARWRDLYINDYIFIKFGGIAFEEAGAGSDTILIQAPLSIGASYTLTLPTTDGSSGEFLQTDGSGNLSWASSSAGANDTLSNLSSPTAVNQSLIPGGSTQDLGSSGSPWDDCYIDELFLSSGAEIRYDGNIAFDFSTGAAAIYVGSASLTQFNPYSNIGVNIGDSGERFNTVFCDTVDELCDIRVKKNVRKSHYGLAAIMALEAIEYDAYGKQRIGFSAQDVAKVIPEITKNTEPSSKKGSASVVRTDLIPVLVQAVQELAEQVNSLKK